MNDYTFSCRQKAGFRLLLKEPECDITVLAYLYWETTMFVCYYYFAYNPILVGAGKQY